MSAAMAYQPRELREIVGHQRDVGRLNRGIAPCRKVPNLVDRNRR